MDIKEIEHLAELSKLEFSTEELEEFSNEFSSLLELADMVKNAEISGSSFINSIDMLNLREDKAKDSMHVDILLENTPVVKKDCIVVPRIME